jgi:AraC family transcriptional regulator, regulatory protein of adaptative response / methylated-DNA-[protein]-cysteine methyltransferase
MQATHTDTAMIDVADALEHARDYTLVAQAIDYIERNMQAQPGLDELAQALAVSPGHLQRTFQRWAGISPKRFLQYLTVEHAKAQLDASRSVLDAAFAAGLSGPGRLHDHFVTVEAMTPGEYKQQAAGLTITYGQHDTPFGPALIAVTPRGLNAVAFLGAAGYDGEVAELARRWPGARLVEDAEYTAAWAARIFHSTPRAIDDPEPNGTAHAPLRVLLKGTPFQIKVWEALLRVPEGALCTYGDIAREVCGPKAARAVGAAVAANPIAYLIPCHRVIRQTGVIHDYRWGSTRKKALLGWEAARQQS